MQQHDKYKESDEMNLLQEKSYRDSMKDLSEHANKVKDWQALRTARKWLQGFLLLLLGFEVFFIAYLMMSQGLSRLPFTNIPFVLNEFSFGFFINVAIVQTCYLIRPIAKNLFPNK